MSILMIRDFAIIFIYLVLLGTSTADKWKTLSTPDWFISQFTNTFLAKIPGGLRLSYWLIATLEALLAVCFLVAIFDQMFLQYALLGSLFLFGILLFGLRLISDFQGSANMFTYFGTTLLCLFLTQWK